MENTRKEKAELVKKLHHNNSMLFLPSICDAAEVKLPEETSYPAIATASASIARSNGFADGENIGLIRY